MSFSSGSIEPPSTTIIDFNYFFAVQNLKMALKKANIKMFAFFKATLIILCLKLLFFYIYLVHCFDNDSSLFEAPNTYVILSKLAKSRLVIASSIKLGIILFYTPNVVFHSIH